MQLQPIPPNPCPTIWPCVRHVLMVRSKSISGADVRHRIHDDVESKARGWDLSHVVRCCCIPRNFIDCAQFYSITILSPSYVASHMFRVACLSFRTKIRWKRKPLWSYDGRTSSYPELGIKPSSTRAQATYRWGYAAPSALRILLVEHQEMKWKMKRKISCSIIYFTMCIFLFGI